MNYFALTTCFSIFVALTEQTLLRGSFGLRPIKSAMSDDVGGQRERWVSGLNQSRFFLGKSGTKLPKHKEVLNYIGEMGEWLKPAVC
jgi:hypothetical protein